MSGCGCGPYERPTGLVNRATGPPAIPYQFRRYLNTSNSPRMTRVSYFTMESMPVPSQQTLPRYNYTKYEDNDDDDDDDNYALSPRPSNLDRYSFSTRSFPKPSSSSSFMDDSLSSVSSSMSFGRSNSRIVSSTFREPNRPSYDDSYTSKGTYYKNASYGGCSCNR